jgi:hypothetical protein
MDKKSLNVVFSDAAPCSLVDIDRRFRGAYFIHKEDHLSM